MIPLCFKVNILMNPWSAAEVAIRALPQERFAFCGVLDSGPDCTASPVRDE